MSNIADIKTTLVINQQLLLNYIQQIFGENNNPEITAALEEYKTLCEQNEKLIKENYEINAKTAQLQEKMADLSLQKKKMV